VHLVGFIIGTVVAICVLCQGYSYGMPNFYVYISYTKLLD